VVDDDADVLSSLRCLLKTDGFGRSNLQGKRPRADERGPFDRGRMLVNSTPKCLIINAIDWPAVCGKNRGTLADRSSSITVTQTENYLGKGRGASWQVYGQVFFLAEKERRPSRGDERPGLAVFEGGHSGKIRPPFTGSKETRQ